jgi:hypothetical protein
VALVDPLGEIPLMIGALGGACRSPKEISLGDGHLQAL